MIKWNAEFRDCLYLNFAIEHTEIERLLPPGTKADTRHFRGKKWGFFSLVFLSGERASSRIISWPRLKFNMALLRLYVLDNSNTPATYIARCYIPGFYSSVVRLLTGMPVLKVATDFPTRANPGGIFNWNIEGRGAGDVRCKIKSKSGLGGQLLELFGDEETYRRFFLNRPQAYYGASLKHVMQWRLSAHFQKPHSATIESCELGFIAADMERHSFPEAISGAFYLPEMSVGVEYSEKVAVSLLSG